jgi:hypothetical protein
MSDVTINHNSNSLIFGEGFSIQFQRTLRIPDDARTYPLTPGLGTFPICRVEDYRDRVPQSWLEHGGVFIPMYQREALWINFPQSERQPKAIKVAVGKINAVSGKPWQQKLLEESADYLVAPPQPWLDGINAGNGWIEQFVAMPLGMGYTIEGQITGKEEFGGIQIIVYEPKLGKFLKRSRQAMENDFNLMAMSSSVKATPRSRRERTRGSYGEMGMAAGGKMKQKIYSDPYGIDTWDEQDYHRVYVHIVNSMMYREITSLEPPRTPVTAETYGRYNLPWFDLYDETMSDIAPSSELSQVKTVREMDVKKGLGIQQDDSSIDLANSNKIKYFIDNPDRVSDGNW